MITTLPPGIVKVLAVLELTVPSTLYKARLTRVSRGVKFLSIVAAKPPPSRRRPSPKFVSHAWIKGREGTGEGGGGGGGGGGGKGGGRGEEKKDIYGDVFTTTSTTSFFYHDGKIFISLCASPRTDAEGRKKMKTFFFANDFKNNGRKGNCVRNLLGTKLEPKLPRKVRHKTSFAYNKKFFNCPFFFIPSACETTLQ